VTTDLVQNLNKPDDEVVSRVRFIQVVLIGYFLYSKYKFPRPTSSTAANNTSAETSQRQTASQPPYYSGKQSASSGSISSMSEGDMLHNQPFYSQNYA
jgi:hypothetical protein